MSESAAACYIRGHEFRRAYYPTIIEAETRRAGEVLFDGLADRLAAYIDEEDRARFLADASAISREAGADLLADFLLLVPIDCDVVCGVHESVQRSEIEEALFSARGKLRRLLRQSRMA